MTEIQYDRGSSLAQSLNHLLPKGIKIDGGIGFESSLLERYARNTSQ